MNRKSKLERQGWTRQFIADEPRLSEAAEEYNKLGFEVHLEPVDPQAMEGDCTNCLMMACDKYKIIYTRPKV